MTKKFRIWDGEEFYFTTDEVNIYPAGFSSDYGLFFNIKPNKRLKPNNSDYSKSRQITIQQWTGLTDSQGVEIYEGDIVFTIYPEYKIAKVFFCANSASFRLLSGNVALPMVTMRTQEKQSPKLINVFEKVIGNIFQNPELLEKC